VDGVMVDIFFGASTLGEPAVTRVVPPQLDAVTFEAPAGTTIVSARVHAQERNDPGLSIVEMRQYGFSVSAEIEGTSLIRGTRDIALNLALAGGEEDPERALVVADAYDCLRRPVTGAQFELVDGETDAPVQTGAALPLPTSSYVYFALPNPACTFTSNEQIQAVWLLANAPVNVVDDASTRSYRLRLKGRRSASDAEPVILSEREVELVAGTVTIVHLARTAAP
jgi:hypothetical protein